MTIRTASTVVAVLALGLGVATLGATARAFAATPQTRYVATTGSDTVTGGGPNDCLTKTLPCATVQHAVDEAAAGDTVSVGSGNYPESVMITEDLTVQGAGKSTIISGAGQQPSVTVEPSGQQQTNPHVALADLSLSNNTAGFGLGDVASTVTVRDTTVSHNARVGILAETGSLTVVGSTITDTTVTSNDPVGLFGSGIVALASSVDVSASTIAGNEGLGIVSQGDLGNANPSASVATVSTSTISGNGEGGLISELATLTVSNSTVTGNNAVGIGNLEGVATVDSSTITDTAAAPNSGGIPTLAGLFDVDQLPATNARAAVPGHLTREATALVRKYPTAVHALTHADRGERPAAATAGLTVTATIVANQAKGVPDCSTSLTEQNDTATGEITDGGWNLSSDAANSCSFSTARHDVTKTDPQLGKLADNGGPTQTELPVKGSAAIDHITLGHGGCTDTATDQRGISRPQGAKCDIGAVEATQPPVNITPGALPRGEVATPYRVALHATGGLGAPYEFSLAPSSKPLPAGLALSTEGVISGKPTTAGTYRITVSVDDPTLKQYAIVITAPATTSPSNSISASSAANSPAPSSSATLANTGTAAEPLTIWGTLLLLAGLATLAMARWLGSGSGRHRPDAPRH